MKIGIGRSKSAPMNWEYHYAVSYMSSAKPGVATGFGLVPVVTNFGLNSFDSVLKIMQLVAEDIGVETGQVIPLNIHLLRCEEEEGDSDA